RYYNGKIGIVSRVNKDQVFIKFPESSDELLLEKETWKNIRYHYDKEKDSIEEEELGSFTQYPVRLAWAITIHKSQGLTFTKAIIDAGASFAPGQVYVALSRLTSLDGLVLYSRIHPESIHTDKRVLQFAQTEMDDKEIEDQLQQEQKHFIKQTLSRAFHFVKLVDRINIYYEDYERRQIPGKNNAIQWAQNMLTVARTQMNVSEKFNKQLSLLLIETGQEGYSRLHERIIAASTYFTKTLDDMRSSLKMHVNEIKVKKKVKKYLGELRNLELDISRKKQQILQAAQLSEGLMNGTEITELLQQAEVQKTKLISPEAVTEQVAVIEELKPKKGNTKRMSLELFKDGKTIPEIAALRGLATGTIEGHLSYFIPSGDIYITDLVPEAKIETIRKVIEQTGNGNATSPVKEQLGDAVSHGEIRAVIAWLNTQKAGAKHY
ncbi:MAG TPA: helix-turn-helix domain-containing protein, partial [Agriterribacter sp.]|nr:helix-turn-helix domain-containing protein [Agriterribacter sp.]